MLRSTSELARQNIRGYIMEHANFESYSLEKAPETFDDFASAILSIFRREKKYAFDMYPRVAEFEIFLDWAQGLPTVLDTCYYYNRSAVEDLGNILEENETEKSYFEEEDAERNLTRLIYRELIKTEGKHK